MDSIVNLKNKTLDLLKNSSIAKDLNYNKLIFYFLFGVKSSFEQFKVNINTKCLVLSQYPGAEIKGLGGLIAQFPKNFEVLCLTNGSNALPEFDPVESASIKKQQFQEVMRTMRTKGYKIFDIDTNTLKNHYSTFKKIDISEVDYIFIPSVYDNNKDTLALLEHFKKILQEKEHKEDLKIIMFESDFSLCTYDCYVDISHIIETKKRMLNIYYPPDKFSGLIDKTIGLNAFRSIQTKCDFAEAFMKFNVDEFLNIPLI
ncbi:MAG: hypothetical protein IJ877_03310 [Candidatus Gastranaerophilales bacterium]|nr:hypothetical protein [Candidatus Gastranaerophilales bacterium]